MHRLENLINPKSVAILGASTRPGGMGHTTLANLQGIGFTGPIYPVHPTAESILGVPCFQNVSQIPAKVDCAVISLSVDKVLPALRELAAIGTRSAVVFASGFAETGASGAQLQEEITVFCKSTGIDLCGPNCLGIHSVANQVSLYSVGASGMKQGQLAIVSQSGSACIVLSSLGRFGLSHMISLGNGSVTDIADYLDYIAGDAHTKVAALFIEALRDPVSFANAVGKMRRAGKEVVALKVGRSDSGAAASAAHTGALATSDVALDAYFRRLGVALVEDYDELTEVTSLLLSLRKRPLGSGLGVLAVSGGELALTCDLSERVGLHLPELTPATVSRLKAILPKFGTPRNPVDATGSGVFDMQLYGDCLSALAEDPGIHIVGISQDCPDTMNDFSAALYGRMAAEVALRCEALDKPVVFFNNVAHPVHPKVLAPLHAANVPVMQGMRNALKAIKHVVDASLTESSPRLDAASAHVLRNDAWVARLRQPAPLTERESKAFLRDHGIRVTPDLLAHTESEAVAAALGMGYPVVLKIDSPDIPHKTEVGGVALNVRSNEECIAAYRQMFEKVTQRAPSARITGVLVQPMVSGGVEAIVGVATHAPFGPGVVVGCGGVLVELVKDAAFELAPISASIAHRMVDRTRLSMLLAGFRGKPRADRASLEALIVQLSQIALAYAAEIDAVDLNPIAVLDGDAGAVVLDALVIQHTQP